MRCKRIAVAIGLALASSLSMGAVNEAEFQALKDSVTVLTQRLADMERELAAEKARAAQAPAQAVAAVPAAKPASSWTDKITVQGDLRGRYENIDQENKAQDRNRSRIRARAAIIAKPQDSLEVGFGLSTRQDGDPVSGNQTLGNGGSGKDIYLDLAYFDWTAAEGLNVLGGKFKNNIYRPGKHALIWDGDLNPEGLGLGYHNGPFFANLLSSWIESDSDSTEAMAWGGQAGVAWPLTETVKLTAGAGFYRLNTEGKGPFFVVSGSSPKFYGNTIDANGRYVYDYEEIEVFADLGFKLFGQSMSLFVDYVKNADADDFDTGWAAGLLVGAAKAKGTWEASYVYQDLERDAVFGLWTDSDFGGGGTDNKGHVLRGAYALSDKTNVGLSYFINEIGENAGSKVDYDRLQLDLNFKY